MYLFEECSERGHTFYRLIPSAQEKRLPHEFRYFSFHRQQNLRSARQQKASYRAMQSSPTDFKPKISESSDLIATRKMHEHYRKPAESESLELVSSPLKSAEKDPKPITWVAKNFDAIMEENESDDGIPGNSDFQSY